MTKMTFQEWREDHQRRWWSVVVDREAGQIGRDAANERLNELAKEAYDRMHGPVSAAALLTSPPPRRPPPQP